MKKHQVIIVEDDVELASLTAGFLNSFEFECQLIHSAEFAVEQILAKQPSLVLLDVMLPDGDGLDICRRIKPSYGGKVIMLTARTELIDQVLGLELGADDYIPKPVEPRLLLAKCRAVLRRNEHLAVEQAIQPESSTRLKFNFFEVDTARREIYKDGEVQPFTNPEYELLMLLIEHQGEVVSRDDIFKGLRGIAYDGQSRQIDIYISNIRQKLGSSSSSQANENDNVVDGESPVNREFIKTVRSKGYVFIG